MSRPVETQFPPDYKEAFFRAAKLIDQMAPYIRNMAVPAEFFADINDHWLFVEAAQRRQIRADRAAEMAQVGFLEWRP